MDRKLIFDLLNLWDEYVADRSAHEVVCERFTDGGGWGKIIPPNLNGFMAWLRKHPANHYEIKTPMYTGKFDYTCKHPVWQRIKFDNVDVTTCKNCGAAPDRE